MVQINGEVTGLRELAANSSKLKKSFARLYPAHGSTQRRQACPDQGAEHC